MKPTAKTLIEPFRQKYRTAVQTAKQTWNAHISDRTERLLTGTMTGLGVLAIPIPIQMITTGVASAQSSAEEAGSLLCQTGLGPLLQFVFGVLALALLIIGLFRGWTAVKDMGSAKRETKKEGKREAQGAALTFGGVFFFAVIGPVLEKFGLNLMSCINFGNVLTIMPPGI